MSVGVSINELKLLNIKEKEINCLVHSHLSNEHPTDRDYLWENDGLDSYEPSSFRQDLIQVVIE